MNRMKIIPNRQGYYELWVNGLHIGNYDSPEEGKAEFEKEQLTNLWNKEEEQINV